MLTWVGVRMKMNKNCVQIFNVIQDSKKLERCPTSNVY